VHGLYRVRKSSLIDYAEGKPTHVFAGEFARSQGIPCCNWGGNAGWVDTAGQFWVPTERGVLVVDPLRISRSADPPRAMIERMVVDGEEVDRSKPIVVSADHKRIEFSYTGIDFHAPEYMTV
jgi:hypothetical protein